MQKSEWKVGNAITYSGEWEAYEDKGTVLRNEKNRLLSYSYRSSMSGKEDASENYATVTYELLQKNNITTLVITQDNVPTKEGKEHSEKN